MNPIQIPSGGRVLAGAVFGPPASRQGILLVHGLDSDQRGYHERAVALVERLGATCLTFDLSGHGESEGVRADLSLRDHLVDVVAAYERLAAEGQVDPVRIGVAGASYGGYLAARLTALRPVERLALRAPALYPDADFELPRARRTKMGAPPAISAALAAVRSFRGPVLIVESERDSEVMLAAGRAYREACPTAERVLIPEAGHELTRPEWRGAFLSALLEFFATTPPAS
jgi:pimeloyl-ACP methyl ester carboxylesterase